MDDRSFLLRIHLCSGIGVKGENKIYSFMQKINDNHSSLNLLSCFLVLKLIYSNF